MKLAASILLSLLLDACQTTETTREEPPTLWFKYTWHY